ncbi:MAG: putative ABC transporter permease [Lachnospiraceae bacterium]|nr:putative ABC transporter permease [Lachnospiraceae bacterium]
MGQQRRSRGKYDLYGQKNRTAGLLTADFFFYVWLFFLLAVSGWLWEGFLYFFKDDMYVNRGFLSGPWLPIYGIGGVMLEVLFHRWRDRPALTFVSSMAVCTMLEYAAGWYLELTWGVKWWDYSAMPWNLQGRICLYSALFFGVGGLLLIWLVSPLFYSLYCRIPLRIQVGAGLFLLLLFTADAAYSAMQPHTGTGVTYR